MYEKNFNSDYYNALHAENHGYQTANWLLSEVEYLKTIKNVQSVIEFGSGNGRFLDKAAPIWPDVNGVDWAKSPIMEQILQKHKNINFTEENALTYKSDKKYDLLVSADFLEHLPMHDLKTFIKKINALSDRHYHVIACYDDGHSHLSIFPAEYWLQLFQTVNDKFFIKTKVAREQKYKIICIITNIKN